MASDDPSASKASISRFTAQANTVQELLTSQTVGLVELSDFRKRRAEALEQKEREAHDRSLGRFAAATSDSSRASTPQDGQHASSPSSPALKKRKKSKKLKSTLSFANDDEDDDQENGAQQESTISATTKMNSPYKPSSSAPPSSSDASTAANPQQRRRLGPNASLSSHTLAAPVARTQAAQRREEELRENLRREFLARQEAVKDTVMAIPFVFYDGTSVPGGVCRVRKGEHIWLFLDKARKVGAERGGGAGGGEKERARALREWARVGVDDLMMVRGEIIIPHHYDFYYFLVNKTLGPKGTRLFDYSADPPDNFDPEEKDKEQTQAVLMTKAERRKEKSREALLELDAEGSDADPNLTKVVDRRWYERNKHIFPASTWEEFDPAKDYQSAVRRDAGGNAFFFS